MIRKSISNAAVLTLLSSGALAYAGHDEAVDPAKLPGPVAKALGERFPGARTLNAKVETKKNRTKYEVDVCHEGRKFEVEIFADGVVDEVEDEGVCPN